MSPGVRGAESTAPVDGDQAVTVGQTVTVGQALAGARAVLEATSRTARLDAEILLARVLGWSRARLLAYPDAPLDDGSARCFDALAARRRRGEPIAYLTGHREFWSLDFVVTRDTLIPRPETEHLVEAVLGVVAPDAAATIADIGTGSGAVAIAIASERPRAFVVGTDRSPAAVAVACANAVRLAVPNVSFVAADACDAMAPGECSVIVSNPPYVAENDPYLTTGDVRFEPREALVSGPRGLDMLDALARRAPRRLVSGGWLVLEHGREQGPEVRALLSRGGFTSVETVRDLAGNERVTLGQRARRTAAAVDPTHRPNVSNPAVIRALREEAPRRIGARPRRNTRPRRGTGWPSVNDTNQGRMDPRLHGSSPAASTLVDSRFRGNVGDNPWSGRCRVAV